MQWLITIAIRITLDTQLYQCQSSEVEHSVSLNAISGVASWHD